MKAIMLSIQPKWCELIASGKKMIEVRKTRPRIETPFKCYIYCTASDVHSCLVVGGGSAELFHCCDYKTAFVSGGVVGNGKVIGEFVCDKVELIFNTNGNPANYMKEILPNILQRTALSYKEFQLYTNSRAGRNSIYGWHISDLKIYDTPKELGEFKPWCEKSRKTEDNLEMCCNCKRAFFDELGAFSGHVITRPPQSWCYVEEMKDDE